MARMVREDSLCGVMSNPVIFEKVIFGFEDYNDVIVKFGDGPATLFVATTTVPISIEDPVVLVAVTGLGGVVEPVFPNVDRLKF